jgi:hypothetical protein
MPKCEGLPDGPCPQKVNNRTVKLSQGDLMLCPKCEAIRFPPMQVCSGSRLDRNCGNDTISDREQGLCAMQTAEQGEMASDKNDGVTVDVTDVCTCSQPFTEGDTKLRCDICGQRYHTHCVGLSSAVVNALMDIVTETGWVCKMCRSHSRQLFQHLQSGQAKLAEEVAVIKALIVRLQSTASELASPTGAAASPPSNSNTDKLLSTVRDADRRKRTVVVSGLQASSTRYG